jgi:hypothetical protein
MYTAGIWVWYNIPELMMENEPFKSESFAFKKRLTSDDVGLNTSMQAKAFSCFHTH